MVKHQKLLVYMNDYLVGVLYKLDDHAMHFQYEKKWLDIEEARPISLSLPLRQEIYKDKKVYHFFNNLLPENLNIRQNIIRRYERLSNHPFDLLSVVGQDCVGALRFISESYQHQPTTNIRTVQTIPLDESDIAQIIRNLYKTPSDINQEYEFRISIAGIQEKTALLLYGNSWHIPLGATPTSHIFKPPIKAHPQFDLSQSCENEYLCLRIAQAFGLPTPHIELAQFEDQKVLIVERFDRQWSKQQNWLIRLPQEDLCQVKGLPPEKKYENDGGIGILDIIEFLENAENSKEQQLFFIKQQILFWLLAATDGHAKNFSIYLLPKSRYKLTPMYDVMSVYPLLHTRQIEKKEVKMAMSLKGKNKHRNWSTIQARHFLSTIKESTLNESDVNILLHDFKQKSDQVINMVSNNLPKEFPEAVSNPILEGLKTIIDTKLQDF